MAQTIVCIVLSLVELWRLSR